MTDQEAARENAWNTHGESTPEIRDAFLAGCAFKESQLLARIERLREALLQIEDLAPINERERRTIARSALAADEEKS